MTPKKLASYIRYKTRTNSTTFTDPDMLLLINIKKDDLATEIIKADEDYFGSPQTADLVLNQREYPLPTDMLNQIKFVEAQLDGTNWIPLTNFDLSGYTKTTDEATIIANFANAKGRAYYDIFRNSLFLYTGSVISVVGGLKLWSYQFPADITDLTNDSNDISIDPTTTSAGFPRAFHELLARAVIIDYKTSSDKGIQLNDSELKFSVDLQDKLDSISDMDKSNPHEATMPSNEKNGYYGFNY